VLNGREPSHDCQMGLPRAGGPQQH
jgi:hypothetical protein